MRLALVGNTTEFWLQSSDVINFYIEAIDFTLSDLKNKNRNQVFKFNRRRCSFFGLVIDSNSNVTSLYTADLIRDDYWKIDKWQTSTRPNKSSGQSNHELKE